MGMDEENYSTFIKHTLGKTVEDVEMTDDGSILLTFMSRESPDDVFPVLRLNLAGPVGVCIVVPAQED